MDSAKTFQIIAIAFLTLGAVFTTVSFATQLTPLYVIGPVCLALGIAFMVTSKLKRK